MRKYIKPKFDEPDLGENPFLQSLIIPIRLSTHEDKDGKKSSFNVETTPIMRVFVTPRRHEKVIKLSLRAKEMLLWLMYKVESSKDYIWIDRGVYMDEMEISLNTFKGALGEMIRKGFLCPTVKRSMYWINPHFMFRGQRIDKYPDNLTYDTKVDIVEPRDKNEKETNSQADEQPEIVSQ